jgi:hypothetical protein
MNLNETYLLCVDPRSKRPFEINLGNGVVTSKYEEQLREEIKSDVERQSYVMKELLDDFSEKDPERSSPWSLVESESSE